MKNKIATSKEFNQSTRKKLNEIEQDIKKGKNLSPRFTTSAEAIKWLED